MIKYFFIALSLCQITACVSGPVIQKGNPWNDKMQSIPGRIECELYDKGGEGIAYHDADSVNNGSGKLNPPNGNFLNEFRMHEGVDISYTKSGAIDNNPYNKIMPELNQLYLGWSQPGEWINYTLKVNETGLYRIAVVYTSNAGGVIALDIDGTPTGGPLKISSTYDARDTVAWRQWHHWNKIDSLAEVKMKKGIHLLTLHIIEQGNMNFDYLAFVKK